MVKNLTFTNSANSTYSDFLPIKEGQKVSLSIKNDEKQQNGDIARIKIGDHLDKENKRFTKTVGIIALVAAFFGMLLGRGPRTSFYKTTSNLLVKLEEKLKTHGTVSDFLQKIQLMGKNILEKLQRLNNFTTIKDSAFLSLSETTVGQKLYLNKICTLITNTSRHLSRMAAEKSYEKAMIAVDNDSLKLKGLIENLIKNRIVTQTEGDTLFAKINKMNLNFVLNANASTRKNRFDTIEKETNNIGLITRRYFSKLFKKTTLKEKIKRLKEIMFKEEYSYMTREIAKRRGCMTGKGRILYIDDVFQMEHNFTRNIDERCNYLTLMADNIAISAKKGKDCEEIKNLYKQINEYQMTSTNFWDYKNDKSFLKKIQDSFNKIELSKDKEAYARKYVDKINDSLNQYSERSMLIQILQFLEQKKQRGLSDEDFNKCKKIMEHMRKKVKKAINNELTYYDKCAEYSVGSAPTDALGVILPILCGSYIVATGKDKDEKIAASLKAGIPIVGGVATTLFATIIMLSNMQGIILGTLVGLGLNVLGNAANNEYKDFIKQKKITQKAIAVYLKNHLNS